MKRSTHIFFTCVALMLVGGTLWLIYRLVSTFFAYLRVVPKEIAASLIAGTATILVATLTVVVGRYFERKKELDALYRERKTEIYDEFLKKFFETFHSDAEAGSTSESNDLVTFLREFMRKLILWSGPEVIESFVKWKDHLANGVPDANSIFLTESFLLSIRKDLRQSNRGIQKGFFAKLFLTEGALFLAQAGRNPKITLAEVAEIAKRTKNT